MGVATESATLTNTATLTATAAVSPTATLTDTAAPDDTATMADLSSAEQQLVEQAIQMVATETGMAATDLTLTKIEAVDWSDSSLGCPQPGMMYMQVITPGYQITLTDGSGTVYDVHSGRGANTPMILCSPGAGSTTAPATDQNPVDFQVF